jgi:hypothetical protein
MAQKRNRSHEALSDFRVLVLAVGIALFLGVGTFLAGTALFAATGSRVGLSVPSDSGTSATRDMPGPRDMRPTPPVSASVCALSQTQNDVGWRITIMVDGKAKTTTTHDYMAPCH